MRYIVQNKYAVVLFGTGAFYERYKDYAFNKDIVVALADNDTKKQGSVIDGVSVVSPETLSNFKYDFIVLLLKYESALSVKKQLIKLGVDKDKILFYDEYIAISYRGKVFLHNARPKVAFVSRDFDYSGSSVALVNACLALILTGFDIQVIVPFADKRLIDECMQRGISVTECPSILCMTERELLLLEQFDFVIVNVLPLIDSAVKIFARKPMLWWVHEPSNTYTKYRENFLARYPQYMTDKSISKIPVFAVSNVAQRAFLEFFPNCKVEILPYCLMDEGLNKATGNSQTIREFNHSVISFALIAGISKIKQQQLFLRAAKLLNEQWPALCRFILIGNVGSSEYAKETLQLAKDIPNVEIRGVLTRQAMKEAYLNEIDVVVCASLEETMSLTITEGMMYGKVCICSAGAGMADYISDGENGFVCKAGSLDSLYEKMLFCARHFDELSTMREKARKTYEENFSMDIFAKRLKRQIFTILENSRGGVQQYSIIASDSRFFGGSLRTTDVPYRHVKRSGISIARTPYALSYKEVA